MGVFHVNLIFGVFVSLLARVTFIDAAVTSPIAIGMTVTASVSLPECQSSTLSVSTITCTFSCTPAGTAINAYISRTVSPTGPAAPCFDVTTLNNCNSSASLTCSSTQCTDTLQVNPALGTLNYEELYPLFQYVVVILAQASATGYAGSNIYNLSIPVQDCDEAPVFNNNAFNVQLPEYTGSPTTYSGFIGYIDVSDPDIYNSTFATLTMSIASVTNTASSTSILTQPFYFNVTTGVYHLITALSFDTSKCSVAQQPTCLDYFHYATPQPVYAIVVTASDGGGKTTTATYTVTISRVYSAAYFTNLPGSTSVGELSAYPLSLLSVTANSPSSLAVTFQLLSVYPSSGTAYFQILTTCSATVTAPTYCKDVALGSTVTSSTFNYYVVPQYNLTIWAIVTTPGGTVLSVTSSLLVNITLVNRQPTPTLTSASMSIGEDYTAGSCFWTITANDRESNPIIYTWVSTTPSTGAGADFYNNAGVLCFTSSTKIGLCCSWIFDQTSQPSYVMKVQVSDAYSTLTPNTFTFTLSIIYRNKPPSITGLTNSSMYVWECINSATANTLSATDPENNTLTFGFAAPQPSNTLMFLWSVVRSTSSGTAPATALLNYVSPPYLNSSVTPLYLNATVSDSQYTVSTAMTINVMTCDHPPYFLNLPAAISLQENQTGLNSSMYSVSSYDKESDTPHYYFKVGAALQTTDSTGYFFINSATGAVGYSLGSSYVFNVYTTPSYQLTICVTNTPTLGPYYTTVTVSSVLTISITPEDRPPAMTSPTVSSGNTTTIYENASITYPLYYLNSTDREGDTVFYKISNMYPTYNPAFRIPTGLNYIEFNTQYANTTPILNYMKTPIYYIVVYVYDLYTTPTSTATLTVSVLKVTRAPLWTSLPAQVTVSETVTLQATLLTIGAVDVNQAGYTLTYTMTSVLPASGSSKFFFNSGTYEFGYNANPNFNYQNQSSYQAIFTCSNTQKTTTSSVVIYIQQRSTPTSSGGYTYTVSIPETQTYAALLWDLRSYDNSSQSITYNLATVVPYTGIFTVSTAGLVKIQANPNLNYRTNPMYVATIVTVNSNTPPATSTYTLTVSVEDEPAAPSLSNLPASMSMTEGVPGSGPIYSPICIDKDSLSLSYSASILPIAAAGNFYVSVSTGVIATTSNASIVYQSTPNIYIVVLCSNSYYSVSATLTINIQYTSYWSQTQAATTQSSSSGGNSQTTSSSSSSSSSELSPAQIGGIVGGVVGALALAGIAYGVAKSMQNQAAQDGTLQSLRQVEPPSYEDSMKNY